MAGKSTNAEPSVREMKVDGDEWQLRDRLRQMGGQIEYAIVCGSRLFTYSLAHVLLYECMFCIFLCGLAIEISSIAFCWCV